MNPTKTITKALTGSLTGAAAASVGLGLTSVEIDPGIIALISAITGLITAITNLYKHWGK